MLSGNFFDIQSFTSDESDIAQQQYLALAYLHAGHPIYQGHFPGNPVVPGVCQVQMIKELVEKAVGHRLRLTESDNIKFLSMINPEANPHLEFRIVIKPAGDQQRSVTATIGCGATVFLKFKGKFEFEG
jgi:3-hydroxyacyl-[acyl-carrier-protein] dehydratase